jgi:DeoR family glycerol-3-phosphate regulon repressor
MFLEERQAKILEILAENGKVIVKELAEMFNVTEDSIRKDLTTLELEGQLKRTYGGAVPLKEKLQITEAQKRRISDVEAKRKIAATCVKIISSNDLVFLDSSTISIAIAEILEKKECPYKIITNMVDVLVMLARNPQINIIFAGGQINKSRDGFIDGLNLEFMSKFRPDISFIGVVGVDVKKNWLSSHDIDSGLHKAKILSISKNSYIMAESRKFGVEANYKFATLENVRGLITETLLAEGILKAAQDLNLEIIVPN